MFKLNMRLSITVILVFLSFSGSLHSSDSCDSSFFEGTWVHYGDEVDLPKKMLITFEKDGSLTLKGGFEFLMPSKWWLDCQNGELVIQLNILDAHHSIIEEYVKKKDIVKADFKNKTMHYDLDQVYRGRKLSFFGFYYFHKDSDDFKFLKDMHESQQEGG